MDEVSHFGSVLRVATLHGFDPAALARETLAPAGIRIQSVQPGRVTVEDAFVSMVRTEAQRKAA